jgi:putative ABC transport system ATP-binding protein
MTPPSTRALYTSALLEANNISRTFTSGGGKYLALTPVSISISSGDFLVITGPSGAGKSTLLNLLSTLDTPTTGEVFFRGRSLFSKTQADIAVLRNNSFGFIFQTPHLLQDKTVSENIALPFHYGAQHPQHVIDLRCQELLEYIGLVEMADRLPATLSGGEMQRVVFARALVRKPHIIFADEPTGSLDATNSIHLITLLKKQAEQGRAVIMVSHDPLSEKFASRILRMEKANAEDKLR